MSAVTTTGLKGLIKSTNRAAKDIQRASSNALKRGLRPVVATVKTQIRTGSGFGARIWGKKPTGLTKLVTLSRVRIVGSTLNAGITLKGIPALIESGGKTKAHVIKGWSGGLLHGLPKSYMVFRGRKGWVRVEKVQHPGSRVRAHHFAQRTVQAQRSSIEQTVRSAVDAKVSEIFSRKGGE